MEIYFIDKNNRYIGHRTLSEDEKVPNNATTEVVIVGDGQEAYFINGEWVVSQIIEQTV